MPKNQKGKPGTGGGKGQSPEGADREATDLVRDLAFRPGPGGAVEETEPGGIDIPYTGEAASTRGSTFAENPATGRTPEEEREALLKESFEKRMRGHESG